MEKLSHLTPEGLKENLNLYFSQYFPTTDQVVHLYNQRGWWPQERIDKALDQWKHTEIRRLVASIRDEEGYRSVHILRIGKQDKIIQEELFTSAKEYHVVIAEYYRSRQADEKIVNHLKKNCYYRYGVEVHSYEVYVANPDDPLWSMDEDA
jgi:hypothetical protein